AAYSSCQVSEDSHIELNSDLLYCNHSCDPTVAFDMENMEVRALKDIEEGDAVTFFYPSSEWDMVQSFQCNCGSDKCLGEVKGAKWLGNDVLEGYWLNKHIRRMVERRESEANGANGKKVNGVETNGSAEVLRN